MIAHLASNKLKDPVEQFREYLNCINVHEKLHEFKLLDSAHKRAIGADRGINQIIALEFTHSLSFIYLQVAAAFKKCDSELEKVMLTALYLAARQFGDVGIISEGAIYERSAHTNSSILIEPQFKVDKYRIDFRIIYRPHSDIEPSTEILVECDGHNFHERTKEQATRDRSKDRNLQALGYRVLRYTGSEIWRDPLKCAIESLQCLSNDLQATIQ